MREVERKYEAPECASVAWGDIEGLGEADRFTLRATYLDTPDLRLSAAGWLLRRREGGHDAGWQCKCPVADADTRDEQQAVDPPAGPGGHASRVPAELRACVTKEFGNVPLVPVAVLVTERAEHPLVLDDARVALLAVDRVEATVATGDVRWCEVEVELVGGGTPAVLDRVERQLRASGYQPARHRSKIGRALADVARFVPPTTADAPAREVLLGYLGKQVGVIQSLERPVLDDAPDAVHKSRVATRRLRSLLRTFEPLLDEAWAEGLRDELKWLAEALGAPRDAEVLREEFGDLLAELGPESLEGPIAHRLLGHLGERHDRAHAVLRDVMAQGRYAELHERLVGLLVDAPWRPDAEGAGADVLPPLVAVARAKVARLLAKAERRPDELERWHDVRKAAKAVRYCTEALVTAFGPEMAETAKLWNEVTETFGTLQDAVVARELIDEVAALAEAAGEPLRTYRILADVQDDRATAALEEGKQSVAAALAR